MRRRVDRRFIECPACGRESVYEITVTGLRREDEETYQVCAWRDDCAWTSDTRPREAGRWIAGRFIYQDQLGDLK